MTVCRAVPLRVTHMGGIFSESIVTLQETMDYDQYLFR